MRLPVAPLWTTALLGLAFVAATSAHADEPKSPAFSAEQLEFFEREVRPRLVKHCYECHSGNSEKLRGGLRLDSRQAVLDGGDTGPAAVPGNSQESLLVDAVNYGDLYQMPPKSKLAAADIAAFARWVEMGLPWPAETTTALVHKEFDLEQRRQSHWAWQPLTSPPLPNVSDASWPFDPLDHFILAELDRQQLKPAAAADDRTWLRRVYFDLIGLPPTPREIELFLADKSPQARAVAVDRLLESPRFGERWARHWLDLVRYAESRGHEFDYDVANAYEYRDYVIRALNADVPYDQFVTEHIAGDLLTSPRRHPTEGFNESILGTGFWFLGEWVHSPVDIRQDECDRFDNMVDVFSKTFLGLTVACARCHDHKFDAIRQSDFYALQGFLQSSAYRQACFDTLDHNREIADAIQALRQQAQGRYVELYAQQSRAAIEQLHLLLPAAADAVQEWIRQDSQNAATTLAADDPLPASLTELANNIASQRSLEPALVTRWTRQLLMAATDPHDPLAIAGQLARQTDAANREKLWRSWLDRYRERAEATNASQVQSIINFAACRDQDWIADGFAFGSAPQRIGQLLLPPLSSAPRFATYGAAARDPLWKEQQLADGVARESGKLSSWQRAGQIIRTPSFELTNQPLHYLVRGSGLAYAVIDSHTMINGPLHGSLLNEFKGDADSLRWITHDLRRYAGHGAHIEFSPIDDGALETLQVVVADKPPPLPEALAADALAPHFQASQSPPTIEQLATELQRVCLHTLDTLTTQSRDVTPDQAALGNWLLAHRELLSLDPAAEQTAIDAMLREFAEQQDELTAQVRRRSRTAPAMWDGTGVDERLLIRGNSRTPGPLVPRAMLEAIGGSDQPAIEQGSGRLELARRLLDPDNPFTSRVYVNRLWHHLMGRGIVASPDNFGVLGETPSHPELLDHLATTFMQDDWSTKRMIRRIVLSRTYAMTSSPQDAHAEQVDPLNRYWHRMPIKRLEGEAIRDAVLAVSGGLKEQMFGPSVPVHLTPFMQGRGRPGTSGPIDGQGRRSIYIAVRRNFLSPMMLAFDTPQPFSTMGRRSVSNVPAQALILMNDPFVVEQSRAWARRLLAAHGANTEAAINDLYVTGLGRPPTAEETASARAFLDEQAAALGNAPAAENEQVWADLCHVLFNVKEFIYIR